MIEYQRKHIWSVAFCFMEEERHLRGEAKNTANELGGVMVGQVEGRYKEALNIFCSLTETICFGK